MLAVPIWLMSYVGVLVLPAGFGDQLWHQHEMLFGFAGAAIAGFILTAIPNWTGRLPACATKCMRACRPPVQCVRARAARPSQSALAR